MEMNRVVGALRTAARVNEAARRICSLDREDTGKIPIIAMTANAFADDVKEAYDAGMNDHVAKPVEVAKLVEVLQKWL